MSDGGWIDELNEAVLSRHISILRICLGMQLKCIKSEEGVLPGLGRLDAEVKYFGASADSNLKTPHMGWSPIKLVKSNSLLVDDNPRFYFIHSYHVICKQSEDIIAVAHHGYDFTAAFNHGNIFGVQFHPEKNHKFEIELMKKL